MAKEPSLSVHRHYNEVDKYFEAIERQIPCEADPSKYEFYKQLLINQERMSRRLRNVEIILDGVVRKGKKFVKVPLPEEIEEGDGTQ